MQARDNIAQGLERIDGNVEYVIYSNEENGYTICDVSIADDEIITAIGTMPLIAEGDKLALYGKWIHNPKYGRQFSVTQYERILPSDSASILKYLSARTVKGVGPKLAQRIVEQFGEDTFDVIENHPEWLSEIKGISPKLARSISESFAEQAGVRSAMIFFGDYFGAALILRIYKKWGSAAVDIARKNPYRLCNEVEGIGFDKADQMARSLGFGEDNFDRIMSGIYHVLTRSAMSNGHMCLPLDILIMQSAELLCTDEDIARNAVAELVRQGRLVLHCVDEAQYIYTDADYNSERYIAKKLALLDKVCPAVNVEDVGQFIRGEEIKSGIQYAQLQKRAIEDALRYGVLVLTGGPGTGKTTVVRALIHIFDSMGYDIALCAPTGRAAKRLSEATSMEAKTVHRLLEMTHSTAKGYVFGRDESNLLDEQVIIVDEASMVDTALLCALLKAVKPGARLIIIGDSDQLPSVGAGDVLRDIIKSKCFATVELTEIFRQAQESLIITNAHATNAGNMPRLDVKDNDFFFLKRHSDRDIANTVVDLVLNRLPKTYGDLAKNGSQVICASKKGEAGTEMLNILLQARLNPPDRSKAEKVFRDRVIRVGDKVMQIRNNYDIVWEKVGDIVEGSGIFNGDIGRVEHINESGGYMDIIFDDKRVRYDFSLLEDLEHAYAITVHKSQGSEYPIVVMPMCTAPAMLLSRNLLYTAITRAQNMVVLVGREEIVGQMVENDRQVERYTGLDYFICKEMI